MPWLFPASGGGGGGGATEFQDLTDVDWATFANNELVAYDSASGKLVGRPRPTDAWTPSALTVVAESVSRFGQLNANTTITSGTLRLMGGVVLPAGKAVNSITFEAGTTALNTGSNQWFCLVQASDLAVLRKTADDTSTAWAANAAKTLTLSSAYTPSTDLAVYVGICVVASTPPTLAGFAQTSSAGPSSRTPLVSGNSTTGLTNPASLGANAGALTAQNGGVYCAVNA